MVRIEGPVTGIPSIIVYLLYLGVVSNPSTNQPMNGKRISMVGEKRTVFKQTQRAIDNQSFPTLV